MTSNILDLILRLTRQYQNAKAPNCKVTICDINSFTTETELSDGFAGVSICNSFGSGSDDTGFLLPRHFAFSECCRKSKFSGRSLGIVFVGKKKIVLTQ